MGYTPNIIILKSDLESNRQQIERMSNKFRMTSSTEDAWKHIKEALNSIRTFSIHKIEMVQIQNADTTETNKKIRKILYDLNIEFTVDY